MANVLNLQADAVELTQETKRSSDSSMVWCVRSKVSWVCWG